MSSLITEEQFEFLPDDPQLRFVAIENIARDELNNLIPHNDRDFENRIKLEYMAVVAAAAEALGIDSVIYPECGPEEQPYDCLNLFLTKALMATTKIRVGLHHTDSTSVGLTNRGRARIELQAIKLRDVITIADGLPDNKRKALLEKLDELLSELSKPQTSYAKIMIALAAFGSIAVSATSFLASAPHAAETIRTAVSEIVGLIGLEKESEEAALKRLHAPERPKALAPPKPKTTHRRLAPVIDDEIPF